MDRSAIPMAAGVAHLAELARSVCDGRSISGCELALAPAIVLGNRAAGLARGSHRGMVVASLFAQVDSSTVKQQPCCFRGWRGGWRLSRSVYKTV